MSLPIQRKRGDAFRLRFLHEGGFARSDIITASLTMGARIVPLTVALHDPMAGIFELSHSGPTADWPIGPAILTIRYWRDGLAARTQTVAIQTREAIAP